ncbi:hypothetical protein NKG05_20605 [Oerskovia sp. M15]
MVLLASSVTGPRRWRTGAALRGAGLPLRDRPRPRERGSGDVFGRSLEWVVEPDGGPVGRAVAVRSGDLVPVQVAFVE